MRQLEERKQRYILCSFMWFRIFDFFPGRRGVGPMNQQQQQQQQQQHQQNQQNQNQNQNSQNQQQSVRQGGLAQQLQGQQLQGLPPVPPPGFGLPMGMGPQGNFSSGKVDGHFFGFSEIDCVKLIFSFFQIKLVQVYVYKVLEVSHLW
jgi:hypothetical protein